MFSNLLPVRSESPRGLNWLEVVDWLIIELRVVFCQPAVLFA